jgi:hypothetical protein
LVLATALVAGAAVGIAGAPASSGGEVSPQALEEFEDPGTFPFVVPTDVFTITVEVCGAQGGRGGRESNGGTDNLGQGGLGGHTTVDIAVTPGEALTIFVGSVGGIPTNSGGPESGPGAAGTGGPNAAGTGGSGSGGSGGGGGGGGGSAVMSGATALAVGGGGGGAGGAIGGAAGDASANGGAGGGATGSAGSAIAANSGGTPGQGGTQTAGGAAGNAGGGSGAQQGTPNGTGAGQSPGTRSGGGGGGGGYFGGGGSGPNGTFDGSGSRAGAGGGSSFPASATFDTCTTATGDGFVILTYVAAPQSAAGAVATEPDFVG